MTTDVTYDDFTSTGETLFAYLIISLHLPPFTSLGFLPDTIRSNEQVYFRSTNVPRTTESLQQIMHGLYPVQNRAEGFLPHLRLR